MVNPNLGANLSRGQQTSYPQFPDLNATEQEPLSDVISQFSPLSYPPFPNGPGPFHGFFLPPPPGLVLPAPNPSRVLQEKSLNLPSIIPTPLKRKREASETQEDSRDQPAPSPRNNAGLANTPITSPVNCPANPPANSEKLKRAIRSIEADELRGLVLSIATVNAAVSAPILEAYEVVRRKEREENLRQLRDFMRSEKGRLEKERLRKERLDKERVEKQKAERQLAQRERQVRHIPAPQPVSQPRAQDFDHLSKEAWDELFPQAVFSRLRDQYSAQKRWAPQAFRIVVEIIESIRDSIAQDSPYSSKCSAMETLRKIGKSIALCDGESELGEIVQRKFMYNSALEDALLHCVQCMTLVQRRQMCDEEGYKGRFTSKLKELMRLAMRKGLFFELPGVLQLLTGEQPTVAI